MLSVTGFGIGNLGICILTCAESLQNMFYDSEHLCKWYMTVVTAVFLLPFCQLRTLHHVSYAAVFSSTSILLCLLIIFMSIQSVESSARGAIPAFKSTSSFSEFVSSSTTAIFSFGGQGLYFETMAEMKRPEQFPRALW